MSDDADVGADGGDADVGADSDGGDADVGIDSDGGDADVGIDSDGGDADVGVDVVRCAVGAANEYRLHAGETIYVARGSAHLFASDFILRAVSVDIDPLAPAENAYFALRIQGVVGSTWMSVAEIRGNGIYLPRDSLLSNDNAAALHGLVISGCRP